MYSSRARATIAVMSPRTESDDRRRILVAGGGVAGLEACLALRSHVEERDVALDLLAPEEAFEYRPLTVLEPFERGQGWQFPLGRFAADQDVTHHRDALAGVDPERRVAFTATGLELPYTTMLIAVGARMTRPIPGALTFRGAPDLDAFRRLLTAVESGEERRIVFAVPDGAFWALPLYELALLTSAHVTDRGLRGVHVELVTPEEAPLAVFGRRASDAVRGMLDAADIELRTSVHAASAEEGDLLFVGGERVQADHVVTLPRLEGRPIPGVPSGKDGFIPVDDHARVKGVTSLWAAGDITDFPLKQGGLASQQADAAAESILAELGFPLEPRPFEPVLQGVLYSHRDPAYLRAEVVTEGEAQGLAPRGWSLWWPPSKIASRFLAPYLTLRAGAPRAPEVRPDLELIPVEVDVPHAVKGVRPPSWSNSGDATPAG